MNSLTRPGGLEITKKAFDICNLPKSAKVLDIGCSYGDTSAYLKSEYDFCVTGIDKSDEVVSEAKEKHPDINFMVGDGQEIDFSSRSFDCVLMECVLSLMQNPIESIHEAFCVLKEGGYLIIHDLYMPHPSGEDIEALKQIRKPKTDDEDKRSCGEELRFACTVNGALILNDIGDALEDLGLEVILFEDRKPDLGSFAASMIFNGCNDDFCGMKQGNSKISYFLLIAKKEKK